MAITLGGVALSDHMVWSDRDASSSIEQSLIRTLGGRAIIYTQQLEKGMPITLEATQDTGWLTYAQVKATRALADVAGATYQLDFYGELHDVLFAHHSGDAFSFAPLSYRVEHDDTDYFIGAIRLITI
jgi:hypothetical protein